jgi:hypothetical protein
MFTVAVEDCPGETGLGVGVKADIEKSGGSVLNVAVTVTLEVKVMPQGPVPEAEQGPLHPAKLLPSGMRSSCAPEAKDWEQLSLQVVGAKGPI